MDLLHSALHLEISKLPEKGKQGALLCELNPMYLRTMGLVMGMASVGSVCSGLTVQAASRGQCALISTRGSRYGL